VVPVALRVDKAAADSSPVVIVRVDNAPAALVLVVRAAMTADRVVILNRPRHCQR